MSDPLTDGNGFREEVVNVKLAELLEQRDVVSLPEQVISDLVENNRMPDIMTANLLGIRVVIEGRIGQLSGTRQSLIEDCKQRVAEGIAPMAVAVAYPEGVNQASSLDGLEQNLTKAEFQINVITEEGSGDWSSGDIEDLGDYLRSGYGDLVQENVVEEAVETIDDSIDRFVNQLSSAEGLSGTEERLKDVVIVPNE
jgi:hypothetical protein